MFDFAWSEIALIAAVALVVIGPKDLPVAIRAISGFVKKARGMASEFQSHVDEMIREVDLKDVKDSINDIRNFDIRSTVENAIDPGNTIRDTFNADPLAAAANGATEAAADENEAVPAEPLPPERVDAPAFMPPPLVPFKEEAPLPAPPPSFIPPVAMLQRPLP